MTRSRRPAGLPDFGDPPLVEVVLSVQFEALAPIEFVDALSSFRSRLQDLYPQTEQHPPLPPAFEIFGALAPPIVQIQLQTIPDLPRFWLLNEAGTEIVQLQTDRFVHNWRKVGSGDAYPRYERIRRTFLSEFSRLTSVIETRIGRSLVPNQCEVTYVNHIDPADAFQTLRILDFSQKGVSEMHGKPEDFVAQLRLTLPSDSGDTPVGRLYVQAGPGMTRTGTIVFQIALTARGRPLTPDLEGARGFLDIGRQAIVRNFAALTTERMHRTWSRRS